MGNHLTAVSGDLHDVLGIILYFQHNCAEKRLDIEVAQNDRRANAHHPKQVSCDLEPSSPFYGPFRVQIMTLFSLFPVQSS